MLDDIILNGCQITEVDKYPMLGLIINNKLNWSDHAEHIIARASKKLTTINRIRHVLPRLALENLYTSMVRPILEYANILYNNCTLSIDRNIESVQRRAALICTGAYKHTEHKKLLAELGWHRLNIRRKLHSLCMMFKIKNNKAPQYVTNLYPIPTRPTYNLRNQANLPVPFYRLKSSSTSFIPNSIRLWNSISISTRNAPSLNVFKKLITPTLPQCYYYRLCSGHNGKLLTRLRLGLSALNAHRFKYNLHDTPYCPHCNTTPETTIHFFFSCPAHHLARIHFFNLLNHELDLDTSNPTTTLDTILNGKTNPNNYHLLLQYIYQYLEFTGRFK